MVLVVDVELSGVVVLVVEEGEVVLVVEEDGEVVLVVEEDGEVVLVVEDPSAVVLVVDEPSAVVAVVDDPSSVVLAVPIEVVDDSSATPVDDELVATESVENSGSATDDDPAIVEPSVKPFESGTLCGIVPLDSMTDPRTIDTAPHERVNARTNASVHPPISRTQVAVDPFNEAMAAV